MEEFAQGGDGTIAADEIMSRGWCHLEVCDYLKNGEFLVEVLGEQRTHGRVDAWIERPL